MALDKSTRCTLADEDETRKTHGDATSQYTSMIDFSRYDSQFDE